MDCDELIDQMLADPAAAPDTVDTDVVVASQHATQQAKQQQRQQQGSREDNRVREYCERLAATVAGGSARKYELVAHAKALTVDQVEELND